jgi:hypothetical protein
LSRRGLDQDSRSRHWKKVGLDSRENLDTFKILVSTIEKSRSRSRNLDFVLTPPSSLKSLDRDREICRNMTFLANLNSLSQSRSRVSQFYPINLKKSQQILKISTNLKNLKNLDSLDENLDAAKS